MAALVIPMGEQVIIARGSWLAGSRQGFERGIIEMSKRRQAENPHLTEPPVEPNDVGAAVREVSYQLTHDLSDTSENLRDAAAFAPLAAIKLAQRAASAASRPRNRTALVVFGAAALLAGMAWLLHKRS